MTKNVIECVIRLGEDPSFEETFLLLHGPFHARVGKVSGTFVAKIYYPIMLALAFRHGAITH